MKRYEWVFVEPVSAPHLAGWVSLLIPFEQMFVSEEVMNAE